MRHILDRRGRRLLAKASLAVLLAALIVSLYATAAVSSAENVEVEGHVKEEGTGAPVEGARVDILRVGRWRRYSSGWETVHSLTTDSSGGFTARLEANVQHRVIVYHEEDGGFDYVPYGDHLNFDAGEAVVDVELRRCAKIEVKGLAYFVETTSIPSTSIRVVGYDTGETILSGGMSLAYGTLGESFTSYIGLPSDVVLVPSGTPFKLYVRSTVGSSRQAITRELEVDAFAAGLAAGEEAEVDLRSIILPESIELVAGGASSLEALLLEKEGEGFYLAVERQRLSRASGILSEAAAQMEAGSYEESFTSLREAYIMLTDVRSAVEGMVGDAARSTYTLTLFIAVTSLVVSSLVYENAALKAVFSSAAYVALLYALTRLHPGVALVAWGDFIAVAAACIVAVNVGAVIAPGLLSRWRGGDGVPILTLLVPMLSIAKRSLRRRWLRFGLTLISVLMLVASFISLTSFSSGYGLSFAKRSTGTPQSVGVLIRSPNPPPVKAAAPFSGGEGVAGPTPLEERLVTWFMEDADPIYAVPKYVNQPQRQYREAYNPFGRLEGEPIFGVLSVVPSLEAEMNGLDRAVVSGRYLTDDEADAVLISVSLAERLGKNVGDTVALTSQDGAHGFLIVGLLGDEEFASIVDLDGEPIIPQKIVELERIEFDGPDYVVEGLAYCEPSEVLVVNQATGANIYRIWINRIDLLFEEGYDVLGFASSTALNRGFRVWASSPEGVYLAELAGYFQGKGLPILVPWLIVVLNVVVTMLNSYYERRHDISIYSSVGMNPSHISGVFLAEAAVIGVVAGSLGYLLGLGTYKFIYMVTPTLQVKQKVSAFWSLAAIGMSLSAVLMGGVVAIRNSTVITPSLRRRWRTERGGGVAEPYVVPVPVHVYEEEVERFVGFLESRLRGAQGGRELATRMIRVTEAAEPRGWVITFSYVTVNANMTGIYTRNALTVEQGGDGAYLVKFLCEGNEEGVRATGGLMRRIGLDWGLERARVVAG
jgi:ABC-type lipoprotein release transport system permease subunit